MNRLLGLAIVAALALGACSGGGNPGAASAPTGLVPAPMSAFTSHGDAHRKRKLVRTKFHIVVPHHKRKRHRKKSGPDFISPSSLSIVIVLNTINGNVPPAGLLTSATTNLTNCSSGCTVYGPSVPPGSDNLSLKVYDALNGGGHVLSEATQTFTITPGVVNTPTVTLLGVPYTLSIGTLASATAGTALSPAQSFTVGIADYDGNTITGTYATPVTVTDSDTSGASTLSVDGGAGTTSVALTNSTDTIAIGYSGLAIVPATIAASATGAPTVTTTFQPALNAIDYVCNGGGSGDTTECDSTPKQIDLYAASGTGSSASFTISELGWSGSPYDKTFTDTPAGGCSSIGSISTADNLTFTATTAASPSAGSCTVAIGDGAGQSTTVTLTYTTSGIGINARHRHPAARPAPPQVH